MTAVLGRAFKIKDGQVVKLNPNAYSKKWVPPKKLTWQEKLIIHKLGLRPSSLDAANLGSAAPRNELGLRRGAIISPLGRKRKKEAVR